MSDSTSPKGTALITGASTGIGAIYADRLARRGYDLILVARDSRRLEEIADSLRRETGLGIETIVADLTVKSHLAGIEVRLETDSRIVMLVNNAGVSVAGSMVMSDRDRQDAMIQLNAVAATRLALAAALAFVARQGGTIINIASAVALVPERFNGVYSGTKAYLLNFSLALHQEVADSGVRVQAVLPGATRTEIWERSGASLSELPEQAVMDAGEMVDAALAGLDMGELVTIPSLPDPRQWDDFTAARVSLMPYLSLRHPAERYMIATAGKALP